MTSKAANSNGVLFESDAETPDLALAKLPVQEAGDEKWDTVYVWHIVFFPVIYLVGLYGGYLFLVSAKWQTDVFGEAFQRPLLVRCPSPLLEYASIVSSSTAVILYVASILGVTAGAHRLWSHRAYKAKWPLQLILMVFQTLSLQYSVINWVRDHRMHHKYVDTDADPHNATRGFFFSHIGWLMIEKHPEFERKVKGLDLSDVENNPILRFQKKYYVILAALVCFILPTAIPVYMWNETWTNAILITVFLRITCSANSTALINSAAHKWGYRPYDKNMLASEVMLVSLLMLGEGFHNYHHAFPWDYKTGEFGGEILNFSTTFIDFFARIGWAYDLKTISDDIIRKRVLRTGDGSHHINRCGEKDQPKEYKDYSKLAISINTKDN